MGRLSTAQRNDLLTGYAHGLTQDMSMALAGFIAPAVMVGATQGRYKKYDDKNAFQIYDTSRALGGPANRIKFAATDPSYDCRPNALEATIDDKERTDGGNDNRLELAKTRTLVISAALAHEKKVFDTVAASVTAEADRGVYSDPATSPIDEIDEQIEAIATASGMMPNRMVLGLGAWRVIKNHPKVLNRANTTKDRGVSMDQFAGMLMNPSMEVRIGLLSRDTTKFGNTKSAVNIVGADVWIFYASSAATEYDPSFMKTFQGGQGGIDAVYMYRDDHCRSDVIAVDWAVDVQVVSTVLVKRISLS